MLRVPRLAVLTLAVVAAAFSVGPASALPPGYSLQLVHAGLQMPVTIRFAPDGRLFVGELHTGRILAYASATVATPTVWATLPVIASGERGLLGLAFHPSFPDSPFVYAFHSNPSPLVHRIVRLRDQDGLGTDYTVLADLLPATAMGRNGGRIAFDLDARLYVSLGDNLFVSAAQDTGNLPGKILRLDLLAKPAADNPFGPNNPIAVYGVRNAFGLCFDPVTGHGYFTDNGPSCDDELNRLMLGQNYGWGPGASCGIVPPGTYAPMAAFTPAFGITGCTTYRGTTYPGCDGDLFFGSYADGAVRRVVFHDYYTTSLVDSVQLWTIVPSPDPHVLDVAQGSDGRIWFSTFTEIWRILEPPSTPVGVDRGDPVGAFAVAPNPSSGPVRFTLPGAGPVERLELVDLSGRRVRQWDGPVEGSVLWDGRDARGRMVPAGIYWARAYRGGRPLARRVARFGH